MIAIGKPFIDILIDTQLSIEEYTVIYCIVYDKRDVIKSYSRNVNTIPVDVITSLNERGFLRKNQENEWVATDKSIKFIKSMVDSYANQKADNPLLGDEDLVDLADQVYEEEFNSFLSTYPTKTIRPSGRTDYLKEGTKDIKRMYLSIIQTKRCTPARLQLAAESYVRRQKRNGMTYIKTLKNWLKQEIWKDTLNIIDTEGGPNNQTKDINYGGKII